MPKSAEFGGGGVDVGSKLYTAWRVWKVPGDKVAWTTSMYLAFIFLALMLDAVL
jgi:hypothetical protein